jgi:LmbE family N-acetylglucosaminyl deacetylase/predicted DNA-binding ArsR family transcriptional regulator
MKLKLIAIYCLTAFISIQAQLKPNLSASEIKLALNKLNVLGSVLYVAAHPDDENTAVISYLAKGKLLRTGYLSLTRGDGGQNLIGPEQSEQLGVIRTQELLEARKIDGGEQFFTRAVDFGYSKSAEETFKVWDKNKILSDVVWVIRKFKPDIIITRFPPTGQGGHGHHTASAMLALEAFELANDPNAYPEQLKYVSTWKPKRIFWNAWAPALQNSQIDITKLPTINVGEFNPLLGKSYTEISALSRSMHKSQGFGSSAVRNDLLNHFVILKGDSVKADLFEGIDLTWDRIKDGKEIQELINITIKNFDEENPAASINKLVMIYKKIKSIKDGYWKSVKLDEIKDLIRACAGLWIEAISGEEFAALGDTLKLKTSVVNRCAESFELKKVSINGHEKKIENGFLKNGEMLSHSFEIFIPYDTKVSNPYWLDNKHTIGSFLIEDQTLIGKPDSEPSLLSNFAIAIFGEIIEFTMPLYKRITDPVDGEVYKLVKIAPPAVINIEKDLYFFNGSIPKEIKVILQSFKNDISGKIMLSLSNQWSIEPEIINFNGLKKNQKKEYLVKVVPNGSSAKSEMKAKLLIENFEYSKSLTSIEYKHILPQTIFEECSAVLESFTFESSGLKRIGYIMGSGDMIPDFLNDLGFDVVLLNDKNLNSNNLEQYDVIITGIRAYNTRDELSVFQKELIRYVENGGTIISQYNTTGDLIINPGLYPLKISRDRVTDENSPVKMIDNDHIVFNHPLKIREEDFEGWIQERGLYFPNEWDQKYEALLSMKDKDEDVKLGSLLYAKYGKGTFIYTGLSFFRQIPAGVEGAIKLFINLIHSGN